MPDWRKVAAQIAANAGVPPDLFGRQIGQESGFDPAAKSPAGAVGIAQIVPQYHPGVDPTDPVASLKYAANWMHDLIQQYGGDVRLALAHYNGGGAAVQALQAGHPFDETKAYLGAILGPQTAEAAGNDEQGGQDVASDTTRSPGQQILDRVVAAKGNPTRVQTLKPTVQSTAPDALPGETEPNPEAVHRFWFADNTYLDTVAQGNDVAVQGGTALTPRGTGRQPAATGALEPVIDPRTGRQIAWRDPNTGAHITIPQPTPQRQPSRKQVVTVNGKHYEYDPDAGTFTPAEGLPNDIKTENIGGRVVTTDANGNVLNIVDARTPEAIQAAGLANTKTSLDIQKDQQALLPQQQLIIQKQLQTIDYVKGLVASGQMQPDQADQYIQNVKDASLAALRGTTPFEEQKQLQTVQSEAATQATDLLRQRLATAGQVGDSFVNALISGAGKAMFRPGQTTLGIDPLALAKQYILSNGGAQADALAAGLTQRAGLSGGGPAPAAMSAAPALSPMAQGLVNGLPLSPESSPAMAALPAGAPAGV